ncbi:MAG: 16S rRNA (guanine(527)-N(7))-methyltransferase RsmG [Chloroflexota bacterium]|nr:16S rRNA (guanine(527)-N(7))-methyltransferase RsmG [Chloroflexota bacterium]
MSEPHSPTSRLQISAEPDAERLVIARASLKAGAAALGLSLSPAQVASFTHLAAYLREGKRRLSLTAVVDPVDVAVKHFLDSLSVLSALPPGPLRVIDVGTGAGFPGLPLKLVRPELTVVFLEATAKKADWVEETLRRLEIKGGHVVAGRAEDVAHEPAHRARYDVALARAVAPLPVLCELCCPFLRRGGTFIALKSAAGAATEVPQSAQALQLIGARLRVVQPVSLPDLPNRVLVLIDQVQLTPAAYPRRPGVPASRPL